MQVLIRAGIRDADEALAAFAEGAARDADDLLLVEQAVAELDAAPDGRARQSPRTGRAHWRRR